MTFMAVPESLKAVRRKFCEVQDKQTVTMAFWLTMSGVGAVPTCCTVLGW